MHPFTHALLEANDKASPLSTSECAPETPGEANTIQFEFTDALGGHGGWKMTPWSSADQMLAAPIPQAWMAASSNTVQPPRGSRLEVEFALVREENGWQACLAFEFLRSRLAGQSWTPLARRADLLSAGGVVTGPSRPLNSLSSGDGQLTLTHSASPAVSVTTTFDPALLLAAAAWLEQHAASLGRPITAGMVVITGARIGPLPLVNGAYIASWTGLDEFAVTVSGFEERIGD